MSISDVFTKARVPSGFFGSFPFMLGLHTSSANGPSSGQSFQSNWHRALDCEWAHTQVVQLRHMQEVFMEQQEACHNPANTCTDPDLGGSAPGHARCFVG